MLNKKIFVFLISLVFLTSFISAQGFINPRTTFTTYYGNLTNLSQLEDTNIPAPNNEEVLAYDSASGKWIASAIAGSGISWATALNGTLAEMSDVLGFDYYNSTNPQTETDPLWTANYSLYNATWSAGGTDTFVNNYSDYLLVKAYSLNDSLWTLNYSNYLAISIWNDTGLIKDWNSTGFIKDWDTDITASNTTLYNWVVAQAYTTDGMSWINATNGTLFLTSDWNATNTSYYLVTNPFSYYNATDFSISDYYLKSNPFGFYNSTNPQTETDPHWLDNFTKYNTTWSEGGTDTFVANYSTFLTHITWANILNGTMFSQADWDTNYTANNDLWLANDDTFADNYSDYLLTKNYALNETLWTDNFTLYNTTWSTTTNSSYIPYTGADKNINFGDNNFSVGGSNLFVDNNSGRVGIGTTSPDFQLTINAETTGGILALQRYDYSTPNGWIYFLGESVNIPTYGSAIQGYNGEIRFFNDLTPTDSSNNLVQNFVLTKEGKVGIGTEIPQNTLNIVGELNVTTDTWCNQTNCYNFSDFLESGSDTFVDNYSDYLNTKSYALNETLWTANLTAYNTTWSEGGSDATWLANWTAYNTTWSADTDTFIGNYSDYLLTKEYTFNESLWSANYSLYNTTWSSGTDTFIANYSTFLTHIDWSEAINGTLLDLSTLLGFSYYNATDFSISNYFTSSEVLGFSYYNATDFSIADYSTTSDILGFSYWNDTYATFNKTYADTLYADIGSVMDYTNLALTNISETFDYNLSVDGNLTIGDGTTYMEMYYDGSYNRFDTKGNNALFIDNVTADYFILPNGGMLWDNATCTFISSPGGSTIQEICDV